MAAKTVAKATSTVQATKVTSRTALIKKALAESNKSSGMRMLFDAGMTVVEVREAFNAPYGYVYGVAFRHGVADTAATRRAPRKTQAQKTKAVAAKVSKAATAAKAKAGRPSATRREANRAPRTVAAKPALSKAAKTRVAAAR